MSENNRSTCMVPVANLIHAPWNPRGEITPESVAGLVDGFRREGQLHEIGVWADDANDRMVCIYGNRRLEAAKACGWDEIRACVWSGITEEQARAMTRVENEERLGVDPVEDAKLIKSLIDAGLSQKEIAARLHECEAKICRRAKLIDLDAKYFEYARSGRISHDALERIAMYPQEVQKKTFKRVDECCKRNESEVRWCDVKWEFDRASQDLESAFFVRRPACGVGDACKACMKRTGAMADLFGVVDGKLGRCMDVKCYKQTLDAWTDATVNGAVDARAVERVMCDGSWSLPNGCAKKWSKKNPCAYWFIDYKGNIKVVYSLSYAALVAERKRRDEEAKAEAADRASAIREREKVEARAAEFVHDSIVGNGDRLASMLGDMIADEEMRDVIVDAVENLVDDWKHGHAFCRFVADMYANEIWPDKCEREESLAILKEYR